MTPRELSHSLSVYSFPFVTLPPYSPVLHHARSYRGRSARPTGGNEALREDGLTRSNATKANPLRMFMTTEAGVLFGNDSRQKGKVLLLDLTMVNPCVNINFKKATRRSREE